MPPGTTIAGFQGEYRFLSNFGPGDVRIGGLVYPRREHAFQAHKLAEPDHRVPFADPDLTAGDAKRRGQRVELRPDWELVKKRVMLVVVTGAFTQHDDLAKLLVATEDALLIEANTWHDNYWGSCTCQRCGHGDLNYGLNYLGRILMMVRDIICAD
jgi:ribA/ribD-fused uncharacterized protein